MYLLDTNILSYLVKGDQQIVSKLSSIDEELLHTCTPVICEIYFGLENHPNREIATKYQVIYNGLFDDLKVYNLDRDASLVFGRIKMALKKKGLIVGELDLLIAAIAISNNLILVSRNIKDFENIPDLTLESWTE
jgi:tRNA(fMet)-specific endonuclease VapC